MRRFSRIGDIEGFHCFSNCFVTAPSDYGSVNTDLTFGPDSSNTQCVEVQLVADEEDEGDEVFYLDVSGAAGSAFSDYSAEITVVITEDSNSGGNVINVGGGGGGGNGGGVNIINGGGISRPTQPEPARSGK